MANGRDVVKIKARRIVLGQGKVIMDSDKFKVLDISRMPYIPVDLPNVYVGKYCRLVLELKW